MSQVTSNETKMKFMQDMLEAYDKMDFSAVEYFCELCHIFVPDKDIIDRHVRSTSHLMQLKKFWTNSMRTSMNDGSDSDSSEGACIPDNIPRKYRKKKLSWDLDDNRRAPKNKRPDSDSSECAHSPDDIRHSNWKKKFMDFRCKCPTR